jgi:hypothetical protein
MPNPQVLGSPLVGCLRLLVQYISCYPLYLQVCNLRTHYAMVTRGPPDMGFYSCLPNKHSLVHVLVSFHVFML